MKKLILVLGVTVILVTDVWVSLADALPLFARRYQVSCTLCHIGFPKLNSFGESFISNGYKFPGEDHKDRSIDTGDEKLLLQKDVPLAIRVDSFFRSRNDTRTKADLETPFFIKILSSAPIKKDITYYFYFLFDERGDVGGVEDAFIYFNDGFKDVDLDLRVGQFQVSDIIFPREQRLTFQDFTYYITPVSASGFVLTYDRAVETSYYFDLTDNVSMGVAGAVANGNGIGTADSDRNFDSDNFKNFYGKVELGVGEQTVAVYGYSGREENAAGIRNEFYRIGPVFNFWFFEDWNVWGNFLYGRDTNARFTAGSLGEITSWGGFAGLTHKFMEDWILSLLYNRVKVYGKRELDANTMTVNLTYYLMRNFKLMAEFTGDLEKTNRLHPAKEHTGVLGIVLAY
ncbi:MAG: hypothetical protein ACE5E9_05295 [Nitrospinaceae bacterium]